MGWASFMEDIIKRFEQASSRIDRTVNQPSKAPSPDHSQLRTELFALRKDVEVCLQGLQRQMEIITDPNFDIYEEWDTTDREVRRLRAENSSLRAKLQQQDTDARERLAQIQADTKKQLSDMEFQCCVRVGTLEAKLKNERREAEHSLRTAKQK